MEPEQWKVGENAGVWVGPVVRSGRKYVAFVCGQSAENARLIAAAPDLLRELKFAVSVLQDNHIARGVAAALSAIRLAEGNAEEDK